MRPTSAVLWLALLCSIWTCCLAGVNELRLPVPTSETIALVAREMGAATFEESVEEEGDSEPAASGRRVQRKLVTGVEDLGDNMEYQEYQGVMGRPGVDFPVLPNIPSTSFSCRAIRKPGYFADLDTDCQVFHICDGGRKISFLCPNGTIFRQSHLICDWWFRVDCGKSVELYDESAEQLAADQRIYKERAEAISRAMHRGANQRESERDRSNSPPPNHKREEQTSTRPHIPIDEPQFAAARQNYENRQNARKKNALQQRRQPRPQTDSPFEQSEQNVNRLQFKNTEESRANRPNVEEQEQQVLSETASFASSRGNRFGKQFFQESYFTAGSQKPPSNSFSTSDESSRNSPSVKFVTPSPTPSPSESFFQSSSQTPLSSSESGFRQSSTPTNNVFPSSTQPTPVSPQRNFRNSGRILPTSSQHNNFRPGPTRNNSFKNSRQLIDNQSLRQTTKTFPSTSQPNTANPSAQPVPDSSQTNFVKVNSLPSSVPPKNNFVRPSPDLIPPEPRQGKSQSNASNRQVQATAKITPNGISFSQSERIRGPTSTTKHSSVDPSANRLLSPTNKPSAIHQGNKYSTPTPQPSVLPSTNRFSPPKPQPSVVPPVKQLPFSTPQPSVLPSINRFSPPKPQSSVVVPPVKRLPFPTPQPSVVSLANQYSSPTPQPSVDENVAQRSSKQRRFTSTTQKPVFTVKFRPNNSFSYVELERTRTSADSSTPSSIPQSSSTTQPQYSSSLVDNNQGNVVVNNPSTKAPLTSAASVSYSMSTSPEIKTSQYSLSSIENFDSYETTEASFIDNNPQTEWTTTRSPVSSTRSGFSLTSSSSFSSYSPTIPEQYSSNDKIMQPVKLSTPLVSRTNEESSLDKLASFSNIDPAEINLLPSGRKPGSRPNLRIPESSGPNALHTLALYYATSESDSGTTPAFSALDTILPQSDERFENHLGSQSGSPDDHVGLDSDQSQNQQTHKSKISDEILLRSHSGSPDSESEIDEVQGTVESADAVKDLSTVLTKATKDSYAFLFNETSEEHTHTDDKPCNGDDVYDLDATKESITEKELLVRNDIRNDLESEQSRGIVQPTPSTKKTTIKLAAALDELPDELKLKDSTDLRELAQVFSRALSAYLEDPDSFRRILSEVRPTEPTHTNTYGTTLEDNEDEVLDFSDVSSSGPRLASNKPSTVSSQKDSINSIDIELINDLAQMSNINDTDFSRDLSASNEDIENTDTHLYTTENPTSLAVDINFLLRDTNHTGSESLVEDAYFPTAGGVDDRSRPRYGGFHNNSATYEYKAYGSELPESVTGKPLTETTFVTDETVFVTTRSELNGFLNKNVSTSASNQIDIESIPDQLGILAAQDINSLVSNHEDCNDSLHTHESSFDDSKGSFHVQDNNEEDIYGRDTDQEKVLIASGSQSFVSRDNYVRFLGAKQEYESKSTFNKAQAPKETYTVPPQTPSTTKGSTAVRGRGAVRYDPPTTADRSDLSNFKRRPHKELAYQNVNLGNGVTLERTKTIRNFSPPSRDYPKVSTESPEVNSVNPVSINEELGFVSEDMVVTTEYSLKTSQSLGNAVRATTYHPSPSQNPDIPDAIPPRGSLRNSWQWSSRTPKKLDITSSPENILTPPSLTEQFGFPTQESEDLERNAFATFTSTLLPPNVTLETAQDDMLEKKAEEIFGKLNKTSADMLMDVMSKAESNTTVRRLVLLLVADRNGRENKSYEESRSQLIQALLKTSDMTPDTTEDTTDVEPEKKNNKKVGRTRNRGRSSEAPTTTTQITTTSRARGSKAYRGTESETAVRTNSQQRPEAQYLRSPNLFPNKGSQGFVADPDARAVELLKSLYNLAARWG